MRKLIKEEIMMKNDLFKTLDRETEEKIRKQAKMEGEINKAKNIAIELLKLNLNINDIIKATQLTKQQIQTLQKQILSK